MLANGTDIFNAPMKFRFDPNLLRLFEVKQGTLMAADGQRLIFSRNIANETGEASIIMNRLPGARGVSGTGALLQLTFQVVGEGATEVTLPEITIRDSQMRQVSVQSPVLKVNVQ